MEQLLLSDFSCDASIWVLPWSFLTSLTDDINARCSWLRTCLNEIPLRPRGARPVVAFVSSDLEDPRLQAEVARFAIVRNSRVLVVSTPEQARLCNLANLRNGVRAASHDARRDVSSLSHASSLTCVTAQAPCSFVESDLPQCLDTATSSDTSPFDLDTASATAIAFSLLPPTL